MAAQIFLGLAVSLAALLLVRWLPRFFRGEKRIFRGRKEPGSFPAPIPAKEAAPFEPASLHPVINENRCIVCGSCIAACPERDVIALVDFETRVINPSHCLGHGACVSACPMEAITLVCGTSARGRELPLLKPNFASQIPGLFIAGELGGMGLMNNAIKQARQALEAIRRLKGIGEGEGVDVMIVGAGPAGFSATLAAHRHGLRYKTLEQYDLKGAVFHYPRRQIVLPAPIRLSTVGEVTPAGTSKEDLLNLWRNVEQTAGIRINYRERVEAIIREGSGFLVRSTKSEYRARAVLLATGLGGSPRRLEIPGEDLDKVVYRMADPEQYRNRRVLVVGGGDSAIEAAVAAASVQASVTLVHHGADFPRASEQNRDWLKEFELAGRIKLMLRSKLRGITDKLVEIESVDGVVELLNDDVIICVGGLSTMEFLKSLGLAPKPRSEDFWLAGGRI